MCTYHTFKFRENFHFHSLEYYYLGIHAETEAKEMSKNRENSEYEIFWFESESPIVLFVHNEDRSFDGKEFFYDIEELDDVGWYPVDTIEDMPGKMSDFLEYTPEGCDYMNFKTRQFGCLFHLDNL